MKLSIIGLVLLPLSVDARLRGEKSNKPFEFNLPKAEVIEEDDASHARRLQQPWGYTTCTLIGGQQKCTTTYPEPGTVNQNQFHGNSDRKSKHNSYYGGVHQNNVDTNYNSWSKHKSYGGVHQNEYYGDSKYHSGSGFVNQNANAQRGYVTCRDGVCTTHYPDPAEVNQNQYIYQDSNSFKNNKHNSYYNSYHGNVNQNEYNWNSEKSYFNSGHGYVNQNEAGDRAYVTCRIVGDPPRQECTTNYEDTSNLQQNIYVLPDHLKSKYGTRHAK